MEKLFNVLQEIINYKFKNSALLFQALTHPSYTNENKIKGLVNYERLEFLGDAILNFAVGEILFKTFPDFPEGELSKLRAALVNEKNLSKIGKKLNIGKCLLLGKGEEASKGREKTSIIANTVESLIGAIYLDSNYPQIFTIIDNIFSSYINELKLRKSIIFDYKTRLQEYFQSKSSSVPEYFLASEKGPDHEKQFSFIVKIDGISLASGKGKSKKEAQQNAAKEALIKLNLSL